MQHINSNVNVVKLNVQIVKKKPSFAINKIAIFLLLTNLIVCPAAADVFNNSQETIYLKAESSARIFPLEPGQTYNGRQDGLVVQGARVGQVYKVVNNINVTVDKNFSI